MNGINMNNVIVNSDKSNRNNQIKSSGNSKSPLFNDILTNVVKTKQEPVKKINKDLKQFVENDVKINKDDFEKKSAIEEKDIELKEKDIEVEEKDIEVEEKDIELKEKDIEVKDEDLDLEVEEKNEEDINEIEINKLLMMLNEININLRELEQFSNNEIDLKLIESIKINLEQLINNINDDKKSDKIDITSESLKELENIISNILGSNLNTNNEINNANLSQVEIIKKISSLIQNETKINETKSETSKQIVNIISDDTTNELSNTDNIDDTLNQNNNILNNFGNINSSNELNSLNNDSINIDFEDLTNNIKDNIENFNELVETSKVTIDNNKSEMKLKLKPEILGEMTLKITVEKGIITAKAVVGNEFTKSVLESNINNLKETLKEQGMEIDKFEVYSNNDSNYNHRNNSSYNGQQRNNNGYKKNNEDINESYSNSNVDVNEFMYNSLDLKA